MAMELAQVGCGGMGLRHLYGQIELRKYAHSFDLTAVCDRHEPAARHLADVAERELGRRPDVFTDFEALLRARPNLEAVDVTTDTRGHHVLGEMAFDHGCHVTVEKPMAISMKACRRMRDRAAAKGRTLSIAENYRRDPICRLARALIQSGAIGQPRFVLDVSVGGSGDTLMHNTAWRAIKNRGGGYLMDVGVHIADLLLFYLGDVESVYAETALFERQLHRRGMSAQLAQFYTHRKDDTFAESEIVEADAEDTGFASLRFASGALGQLTMTSASHAHSVRVGTIHGSKGTLEMPGPRSGRTFPVHLDGKSEPVAGDALLPLAPDFRLDPITAKIFETEKPFASYDLPFAEVDRKLVAIEYEDFAEAARTGRQPEVDPVAGMKAVGLAFAVLESGTTHQPVDLNEVLDGRVAAYQQSIDEEYAI